MAMLPAGLEACTNLLDHFLLLVLLVWQESDGGILMTEKQSDNPHTDAINTVVKSLYKAVSCPAGGEPDWNTLRSLFHRDGFLIPSWRDTHSEPKVVSIDNFIKQSQAVLKESDMSRRGFTEYQIHNRMERFGNIAHVMSTYEFTFEDDRDKPMRGINSIQLIYHQDRWWTMSILWDDERPENPIPDEYLT
jgi:hypothetical protein